MNNKKHQKFCKVCMKQFWTSMPQSVYCGRECTQYDYNHNKAKRMSNKLTPAQREVMIALQEYFIQGK